SLADRATSLLAVLDPAVIQQRLRDLLDQVRAEIERVPDIRVGSWIGTLVASLLRDANLRISPASFDAVLDFMGGTSGADALTARAGRIADSLTKAKTQVESFDLAAQAATLVPRVRDLRTAAAAFSVRLDPGSGTKLRVDSAAALLDLEAVVSR